MKYDDVLELPLKVFTIYNKNINRLRAEEDIRSLRLSIVGNAQTSAEETFRSLMDEVGETIIFEHNEFVPMEEGAFEKLASLQKVK